MNVNLIGLLFYCLISLFSKDYSWLGLSAIDLPKKIIWGLLVRDQPIRAIQPAGRTHRPPTGCMRQVHSESQHLYLYAEV